MKEKVDWLSGSSMHITSRNPMPPKPHITEIPRFGVLFGPTQPVSRMVLAVYSTAVGGHGGLLRHEIMYKYSRELVF